jgi:hypothetical protein
VKAPLRFLFDLGSALLGFGRALVDRGLRPVFYFCGPRFTSLDGRFSGVFDGPAGFLDIRAKCFASSRRRMRVRQSEALPRVPVVANGFMPKRKE